MSEKTKIIYCRCAYYQIIPDNVKSAVLDALKNAGVEFEAVPDLCRMCADHDPTLKLWAKADAIKIIACYPRAVKWLFHFGGAPLPQEGVEFLNMRTDSIEKITSSIRQKTEPRASASGYGRETRDERRETWIPWFPVIDYDRCKNCKQCFNFCLFGVYELSKDGKVKVTKPANCKTNCPACARMCPNSAIMFPKYADGTINGDETSMLDTQHSLLDEFQGSSIENRQRLYDAIRQRSRKGKRFSKDTEQHYE